MIKKHRSQQQSQTEQEMTQIKTDRLTSRK